MVLDLRVNKFIERPQYIFYDKIINGVPLEIIFDENSLYEEGIEFSNYNEESFITFKFSKESYTISSITFVNINSKNIIHKEFMEKINISKDGVFYSIFLDIMSSTGRTEEKTSIYLDSSNNFLLNFNENLLESIEFFNIDEFLSIGINDRQELTSILLKELTKEQIDKFFYEYPL